MYFFVTYRSWRESTCISQKLQERCMNLEKVERHWCRALADTLKENPAWRHSCFDCYCDCVAQKRKAWYLVVCSMMVMALMAGVLWWHGGVMTVAGMAWWLQARWWNAAAGGYVAALDSRARGRDLYAFGLVKVNESLYRAWHRQWPTCDFDLPPGAALSTPPATRAMPI